MTDAKNLQTISMEEGKNLILALKERYNAIIHKEIEAGRPVPIGLYTINKREKKLVPVRLNVNFETRKIKLSLRE